MVSTESKWCPLWLFLRLRNGLKYVGAKYDSIQSQSSSFAVVCLSVGNWSFQIPVQNHYRHIQLFVAQLFFASLFHRFKIITKFQIFLSLFYYFFKNSIVLQNLLDPRNTPFMHILLFFMCVCLDVTSICKCCIVSYLFSFFFLVS